MTGRRPVAGSTARRPEPLDDPPDLRLVLPALAAWLVAWQGPRLPPVVLACAAAVLAVVPGVLLLRSRSARAVVAAAVCGCTAAAALVTALGVGARTTGPVAGLAREQAAVAVQGRITVDPRVITPRTPRAGPALVLVRLRVERVEAQGRAHRVRTPLLVLTSDTDWLGLLPSQVVRAEGRLRPADPGDDVAAVLSGRGGVVVLSAPSRVQRVAGHLREGLRAAVSPLPDAERGLLPGLVVGDTSRMLPEVEQDFRALGLTHLTAVSGTNCTIVVGAVLLLSSRLRLGLRAGPALAAVALVGFVVLARPEPSVLRAALMGSIGLLGMATGTRRTALPALCAAVLGLLLVSPTLASAPGFALSVLATAGLLVLAPPWTEALAHHVPRWLAATIAVPAAAQVACGPVVVAVSSHLGLLAVPANLLAVPAVAPATVAGVLAALVAPVWLPAASALAWVGWLPCWWLVLVARVGARLPGASVPWPEGGTGALLLAGLTALVLPALSRRWLRLGLLAATTGVVVTTAGASVAAPAWPPAGWVVAACDVGQGDALVVRTGRSSALVVDAGPDPPAVDRCLRRLGVRTVPVLLLSHPHADHVAGVPGVLRGRRVGLVQVGPSREPGEQETRVRDWAGRAGVPVVSPGLGEVRSVGPVRWTVLGPARTYRGTRSDPNNASLVVRVEVAGVRVLLTGDVEPEAQADLVERGVDVRADVLKTPHHGSAHQSLDFLDAVGPRLVLTSVGAENTYGHPSAPVLAHLQRHGALGLRTDLHGDLAVVVRDGRVSAVGSRAPP